MTAILKTPHCVDVWCGIMTLHYYVIRVPADIVKLVSLNNIVLSIIINFVIIDPPSNIKAGGQPCPHCKEINYYTSLDVEAEGKVLEMRIRCKYLLIIMHNANLCPSYHFSILLIASRSP